MVDKKIPDEAPLSLESFYPLMSRKYWSTSIKVLWIVFVSLTDKTHIVT